jgi:hypothetical protein
MGYADRILEIEKELSGKTLGEAEEERGISDYDYTGVEGYGYILQPNYPKNRDEALEDTKTSKLDELFNLL